ncbi:hypothetical protein I4U23_023093 [Adineta vaga]|nr:hypothetical protein I4U23_023093 [Adineta vaga]
MTTFEDLSNEILYEIFDLLHSYEAFHSFYDLNQRFRNLFIHSNLLITIDISFVSKSIFNRYFNHIIIPHAFRIKSLRLSNAFASEICLSLCPIMINFTQLQTLTLNNIDSYCITRIVDHLSCLSALSSLTITLADNVQNVNDIYGKIFHLPTLKYCEISLNECKISPTANAHESSSIEHLVMKQRVYLDQFDDLLSYVPQLQRLTIDYLCEFRCNRTKRSSLSWNSLTNVSIKMQSISFDDFHLIAIDYFRHVQVLNVLVDRDGLHKTTIDYLDANRWENLISTYISSLRFFNFRHVHYEMYQRINRPNYQALIDKFNSSFWMKHQWFFAYQFNSSGNVAIFFSKNSYEKQTINLWSSRNDINEDPTHHIYLHDSQTMKQYAGHFPNTNQLTLLENFNISHDSCATNLQFILPMKQLTKLTVNCRHFPFEQLIVLFQYMQNVHTLKVETVQFTGVDFRSIQQNEAFQIASKTNTVMKMIIDGIIRFDQIKILLTLFSRMKYFIIDIYVQDFKLLAEYLWPISYDKIHHLCMLSISNDREDFTKEVNLLILSSKLPADYSLNYTRRKCYLWW